MAKWEEHGEIMISDLPNGFLLTRCPSHSVMQKLLADGPWSLNGLLLQLSSWQPFFEHAFTKLTYAAIWVQLHDLQVEFWDGESLETITAHLDPVIKINDLTLSLTGSKFARICIEINLSKPLCRGFWLGDDSHQIFVVVLYERLPTFCYTCGVIWHCSKSNSHAAVTRSTWISPPPRFPPGWRLVRLSLMLLLPVIRT